MDYTNAERERGNEIINLLSDISLDEAMRSIFYVSRTLTVLIRKVAGTKKVSEAMKKDEKGDSENH